MKANLHRVGRRFGLFEVDGLSGELRKQGRRLRLRGRPIDILLILLERPGEVVTREQLRERLWPADTFVDFDHGLNTAVNPGILTTMGRMDDAVASARRAVELDPLSATANTTLGVRYVYAQQVPQAQFRKTLDISPGFAVAPWGLAQCYRLQGRTKEEIEQLRISVQLSGNSAYMRSQLGYGYALSGDRAAAEAIRRELLAEAPQRYVAPYHIALIAAGLADVEEAVRWLERAADHRSGWLVFLPVQPEFDSMRQTPAFRRLLARVQPAR